MLKHTDLNIFDCNFVFSVLTESCADHSTVATPDKGSKLKEERVLTESL